MDIELKEQYLAYIERLESLIVDLSDENKGIRDLVYELQFRLMNREQENRILFERCTGKRKVEMIIN